MRIGSWNLSNAQIGGAKMEKWKQVFLIFTVLCLVINSVYAQERDSAIVRSVIHHGLNDAKEFLISPARWEPKEWAIAGGVTAATGALILWGDQPVYNFSNTLHSKPLDVFFRNAEPLGNYYPIMVISAFMIKGLIDRDNYSTETALVAAEAMIITTVAVQIVKNTVGRTRPNAEGTTSPHQFNGPFFKGTSFYSGHTTTAFTVASVFAYRYRDTKWVPVLAYGLATIAGMERIYDNRHWSSDVLMGAAIGSASGIFLCRQWEKKSIKFYPSFTPYGGGISLVIPIK